MKLSVDFQSIYNTGNNVLCKEFYFMEVMSQSNLNTVFDLKLTYFENFSEMKRSNMVTEVFLEKSRHDYHKIIINSIFTILILSTVCQDLLIFLNR